METEEFDNGKNKKFLNYDFNCLEKQAFREYERAIAKSNNMRTDDLHFAIMLEVDGEIHLISRLFGRLEIAVKVSEDAQRYDRIYLPLILVNDPVSRRYEEYDVLRLSNLIDFGNTN